MFRQTALVIIGSVYWVMPAAADINVEFRPPSQTVSIGDTVSLGLYTVSDDQTDQLLAAAQVIFSWDLSVLQFLGGDDAGAVPLLSSGFPAGDPFNLNEVVPPQDGDGFYVAFAPLGDPVAATPAGTLLITFQFLVLSATPETPVDILASGGSPVGQTIVFSGTVPGLDVTGTLTGATVSTMQPCSKACPTDVNGDLATGPFDLATLLGCWGPIGPGICQCLDANTDGDIGPFDLASLLGNWGPCP